MIFFDSIKDFIQNFDRKEMIRWSSMYVGVCVVLVVGIMVRHVILGKEIQSKCVQLNKVRSQVQEMFTQLQVVQAQKDTVDAKLKQDKNFNIQKFMQDLLTQNNLTAQVTSKFSHEKLPNGYIEEKLQLNASQITTQQLCELILAIEQQALIYIPFVDITRMAQAKKINVSMSVATLRAEE